MAIPSNYAVGRGAVGGGDDYYCFDWEKSKKLYNEKIARVTKKLDSFDSISKEISFIKIKVLVMIC